MLRAERDDLAVREDEGNAEHDRQDPRQRDGNATVGLGPPLN